MVAYLRVSTDRQAEEGLGLEIQRNSIAAWAKSRRDSVVEWHSDEGVSGSNGLDSREALPLALDLLKHGDADGLVVYRLDRLARDLIVQETLLAEVKRLGASVFSTAESESAYLIDDPEDPSRRLIRQVLGAVAEYERSMIALRLRAGRRAKSLKGGFAYGSPPFGYRADGGELVPDEREQVVLARAVQLRSEGMSLREAGAVLDAEGLKPKRSRNWHPTSLARALRHAADGG
ncbi:recombinase family protein [Nocardioides sp. GXQ0305]|uniref:recombinase family protein n=1 Tax=Nocardioides sp. GXQ0305 TaxID=3423912 RepID=UPI003D7E9FD8